MESPDLIAVVVSRREDITADKVDIHVTVKGTSLVTGNAALKQAREVSQLVSALAEVGVKEADIILRSIHTESSSGILGRATSASYQLRVRCHDLDLLADILGVVTAQKNARLDYLTWRYSDEKAWKRDWLNTCLAEAKEKAAAMASSLGVKLLGVHALFEKWDDSEQISPQRLHESYSMSKFAVRHLEKVDLGFPLSHSKSVELLLETRFRVSEFKR